MTKPEATPQPAPAADAQPSRTPTSGGSEQLLQKLGKSGGPGSQDGTVGTPEELEVPWGETTRKVKVADLVAAAQKREELQQLESTLDKRMKALGNAEQLQALHETIQEMSPQRRAKFLQFLQSEGDDSDDEQDPLERAMRKRGKDDDVDDDDRPDPRLERIEQALGALAGVVQKDLNEKQQRTLAEQTTSMMDQWPSLKGVSKSDSFWHQAILAQYARDPKSGLEKAVERAAQARQRELDRKPGEVLQDLSSSSIVPPPSKKVTGEALMKGGVADIIRSQLASR